MKKITNDVKGWCRPSKNLYVEIWISWILHENIKVTHNGREYLENETLLPIFDFYL